MHAQAARHILQLRAEREPRKYGVEHVQAVPALVDRALLGHRQLARGIQRALLEKVVHLVARVEKVAVAHVRLFAARLVGRGELGERMAGSENDDTRCLLCASSGAGSKNEGRSR